VQVQLIRPHLTMCGEYCWDFWVTRKALPFNSDVHDSADNTDYRLLSSTCILALPQCFDERKSRLSPMIKNAPRRQFLSVQNPSRPHPLWIQIAGVDRPLYGRSQARSFVIYSAIRGAAHLPRRMLLISPVPPISLLPKASLMSLCAISHLIIS